MLTGIALFAFSVDGYAQPDSSRVLEPVPVFTRPDSITRIAITGSSVPHFVLNEEKLASLGVNDVGSALKFIPGAQIRDYGGMGGIRTISFRSLGATHTGVVVDGIRIPNVQSGSVNLSFFEIFGVKELEFTSGQVSVSTAPASAFLPANVISITSSLAQKPEKADYRIFSNATTISGFEEGILFRLPVSGKFFFGMQGMMKFGRGDYPFRYKPSGTNTIESRTNASLFMSKIRAVAGLELTRSRTLFSFHYLDNHQELPGAVVLYNPSNDQELWNRDYRAGFVHEQSAGSWRININGFYQSAFLRYHDPHFLNLQGFVDDRYLQQNGGGGVMLKRLLIRDRSLLYFGSDVVFSKLSGDAVAGVPRRMENNSVFGFTGEFGRMIIKTSLTLQAISDHRDVSDTLAPVTFFEPSPFISVGWKPFPKSGLRFRSFYKRAFTMPTFNDLYYNFVGNTGLRPEKAHLFNLGATWTKGWRNVAGEVFLDAFYHHVFDRIVAIPTKDLFNWSMQNIGVVTATGWDGGFLVALNRKSWKLALNGAFTFNLSLDRTMPGSSTYDQQIPYTPFYSGTGGAALSYKHLGLQVNAVYCGFRYSLNENIYANYLEPFTDVSVVLSFQADIVKRIRLDIRLAAMNVLNRNYEVIRSFPMPGRHYQVTFILSAL